MNKIICGGLVIALLMTGVMSVATAEEYSDDYREGFYTGAYLLGQANYIATNLYYFYISLGGDAATDEAGVAEYNNQTAYYNEVWVQDVNNILIDIYGEDDNRTTKLGLAELPLIEI